MTTTVSKTIWGSMLIFSHALSTYNQRHSFARTTSQHTLCRKNIYWQSRHVVLILETQKLTVNYHYMLSAQKNN